MAEYIPGTSVTRSAAMTALRRAPAPDDNDVDSHNSVMNVDYLSHEWQEEADVWASWRHTTRHKNDIANGVRLENASWRTWWKQRNNLKTVSPETLNWLKDSDVTWLYGPLHTAAEPVPPARVASTEDRLDLVKAFGKKPILKHRSISELLSIPRGSSPSLEASQLDAIPEGHESPRPVLYQTKSESYITRTGVRRVSPPLPDLAHAPDLMIGEESAESPKPGSDTDSMASNNTKRHITFNTFVEQCIAIDKPVHATHDNRPPWRLGFSGSPYSGDDECEDDAIYEDDEDTVLTMRSTSSSGQSSPASSRRPSSSANSRSNSYSSDHVTIQAIAPTMLKTQYDSAPGDLPAVVFVPPLGSPYAEDPTIAPTRYAHQPSPGFGSSQATLHIGGHSGRNPAATRSQWEDDDGHRGVGFDFFGGPDVGMEDEYESTKSSPRLVSTSRVSPAPPHASASGSVSPTTTTHLDLPKSPPTSPAKGNKLPGKSILKPSFPDAAIAEALRESVDELDHYFSQGSNPVAPPTSCGAPASQMHEPASEGSALPTSLDSSAARISPSMSSEHLNTSVGAPARGRSAVRIPGTAIGIADRERSASSKGSSPIGSVSPNSRSIPTGSSSRTTVVRVGGSRMGRVHPGASSSPQNTRSPSRGAVSSTSSGRSPSPPQYNGSLGDGVIRNEGAGSNVSVQREGPFQPSKSTPVRSPTPTKRLSMDIVPVLSTESQLAQAQQPPGSTSRRRTSDSPAGDLSPEPAARHVDGENAYARLSRSEEVGDNMHAAASEDAPSARIRGGVASTRIGFDDSLLDGLDEGDVRAEGTLVSRAVDIVTSARGLFGAIWNAGGGQTSAPAEPYSAVNGRHLSD